MGERLRAAVAWLIIAVLLLGGVWSFVLGVDWAERNFERAGADRPLQRILYLAAGAWYLVLAPILLLRPTTAAALSLRGACGAVLVHAGLVVPSAALVAIGTGVVLHAVGWLVGARRNGGGLFAKRRRHRVVRLVASVIAVAALECVVLLEARPAPSRAGDVLLALAAFLAGAAAAAGWYPRPRRRPILRSLRSVFRRRGAARLLGLRLAVVALGATAALGAWSAISGVGAEEGPFRSRFRAWGAPAAVTGLLVGSAGVRRWLPRHRSRHRRPAPRPLVAGEVSE